MHRRTIGTALAVALLPFAVGAQTAAPPAAHDAPKSYVPGLEQFMGVIQNEHAKLWYAEQAGNWELAAYQLSEIKEVMSDVQDLVPTFKNLPLAQMIDAVITGPISDLEKVLDAKDSRKFSAGYGKLTEACNSCHQAASVGFIRIRQPTGPAFPNQDFAPKK
jgi:hypothetical protein